MAYRNYRRSYSATPRTIVVKYEGKCAQCGATINAGEHAEYTAAANGKPAELRHIADTWDAGTKERSRCFAELRRKMQADYVSEGLGENVDFCPSDNS